MRKLTLIFTLLFPILMFPSISMGKTTLSCKSVKSANRAEIDIDRNNKKIIFWDIPANTQNKFNIPFSIFFDENASGVSAGHIGAFSYQTTYFLTLTINKKNFNTTFATHARDGGMYPSPLVELEKYKCRVGSL